RRRYGGCIVHGGVVMLFAAFTGLIFKKDYDVTLEQGDAHESTEQYGHRWRFVSTGLSLSKRQNTMVQSVGLETWRDGKLLGFMRPEKRTYFDSQERQVFQPLTAVAYRSNAQLDTYIVLAGVTNPTTSAEAA